MFLVGGQVINGFSNTPVHNNILTRPYLHNVLFFSVPVFVVVAFIVLYRGRKMPESLDRERLLLLALISVYLASFFGVLTRTDASHLLNTLISLPIVLALTVQVLPSVATSRSLQRSIVAGSLLLVVLFFSYGHPITNYYLTFKYRVARFAPQGNSTSVIILPDDVPRARIGFAAVSPDERFQQDLPVSFNDLLSALNELHSMTGNGKVYVQSFPYVMYPGAVYFLADLHVPDLYLNPDSMVFSEDVRSKFLEKFNGLARDIDYVVSAQTDAPEVKAFLAAHPDATALKKTLGEESYYIYER